MDSLNTERSIQLLPVYTEQYRSIHPESDLTRQRIGEISCIVTGTGFLRGNSPQIIKDNSIFLIPPSILHYEESEGYLDTVWVGIQGSYLNKLEKRLHITRDPILTDILMKLWRRSQQTDGA